MCIRDRTAFAISAVSTCRFAARYGPRRPPATFPPPPVKDVYKRQVSVPVGLLGTVMGYYKLRELSERRPARIDWPGNITFGLGLILVMVGITYGIEPYGGHTMGWTSPLVLICLIGGVVLLGAFCVIETKVDEPMFRLQLFKIRAFTAGVFGGLLAALSRGGLMFMLIIWLQGIWLPLHGYSFSRTPLWAGIAMLLSLIHI